MLLNLKNDNIFHIIDQRKVSRVSGTGVSLEIMLTVSLTLSLLQSIQSLSLLNPSSRGFPKPLHSCLLSSLPLSFIYFLSLHIRPFPSFYNSFYFIQCFLSPLSVSPYSFKDILNYLSFPFPLFF